MGTVTWDGSADEHWDTDANWDTGTAPTSADDVIIPDASTTPRDPELTGTSPKNVLSIKVETGGIIVGAGSNIRAYGENGSGMVADFDGEISGVLSLQIKTDATTSIDLNASSGNIEHLHLDSNGSSQLVNSEATCEINGNLTINSGEFNANGNVLTVAGNLVLEPTATAGTANNSKLTCGSSTVTVTGKLDTRGTWYTGGGNYTPKSIYDGGSGTHTYNSMQLIAGTDVTLSSGVTSIVGSDGGAAFRPDVNTTYNSYSNGSGTVKFTSASDQILYSTSEAASAYTQFYNLTLEKTSSTLQGLTTVGFHIKVGGNLTITSGELDTATTNGTDHDLTVAGNTQVGSGSGDEDDATLTCNDSAITLGSGYTTTFGLAVKRGGTFTGGGGTHIIGSLTIDNDTRAKCTLTSGDTTMNGEHSGDDLIIDIKGSDAVFAHGGGTVKITFAGPSGIREVGSTLALNNLTINHGSVNINLKSALSLAGNLFIADGELDTDSDDFALTVDGDVTVNGTLVGNDSAISMGSLTINGTGEYSATSGTTTITSHSSNWVINNDGGTFTHNNGLVHSTQTAVNNAKIDMDGDSLYDLQFTTHPRSTKIESTTTIANDFTLTSGYFSTGSDRTITVTGDVLLTSGVFYGNASAVSFGSLTISSGGQYSATSGVTKMSAGGTFSDGGTYTHNNGTFAIEVGTVYVQGASETAFYDVATAAGSGIGSMAIYTDKIIEHDCSEGAGTEMQIKLNGAGIKLTFGTDSYASDVDITYLDGTDALTQYIYSANELKPAVIPSTCDYPRFMGIAGQSAYMPLNAHIKWLDIQKDLSLPEAAKNLILDGDCSFAAVTVGENNTLDIAGNRMECSGLFSNIGTTNFGGDGSMLIASRFDIDGTSHEEEGATLIVSGSSADDIMDFTLYSFVGDATTNILFNNGTTRVDLDGSYYYLGNIIAGSPIRSQHATDNKCGNLIIPTGGTFDADDDTITVAGDLTMAGGLIGESCFSTTSQGEQFFVSPTLGSSYRGSDTGGTIEAWFKTADGSGVGMIFTAADTDGSDYCAMYMSGGIINFEMFGASITAGITTGDDKWHHVAVVSDGATASMYIDGKLSNSGSFAKWFNDGATLDNVGIGGIYSSGVGSDPPATGFMMNGEIDEVRVWSTERTITQIKENMFSEVAADATGLVNYWKLNEGTGDTTYDSCTNTTDIDLVSYDDGTDGWAGAGTFTGGTSTLKFTKAGTQYINYLDTDYIAGLHIAAGSTTIMNDIVENNHSLYVSGNLTVSGTLQDTSQEYLRIPSDFVTEGSVIDVSNGDVSEMQIVFDNSAGTSINLPASTWKEIDINYGTVTLTGDVTSNNTFRARQHGSAIIKANGNTMSVSGACRIYSGATLDLTNSSTLLFHTGGGEFLSDADSTLLAGGGGVTIKGYTSGDKSDFDSQNDFKVVGTVENLNVTNEELNVTGKVINCTGEIIQQHASVDAAQQLDYDSADDRDIMMGRDLDKNTELVG